MVYQMARTTDDLDQVDQNELVSTSDSQTGFLPEAEKFSLKTVLSPPNMEPSKFSGLIVNISTSLIGKKEPALPWNVSGVLLVGIAWFLVAGYGGGCQKSCCWMDCAIGYSVLIAGDAYRNGASLSVGFGES